MAPDKEQEEEACEAPEKEAAAAGEVEKTFYVA